MSKAAYLLAIPVIAVAAWGGTSWYIGQQTKPTLENLINTANERYGAHGAVGSLANFEQGLLSNNAEIKFAFNQPPYNEYLKDLKLKVKTQNGPIFFGEGGFGFGLSRAVITLDQASIQDPTIKAFLQDNYAGKDPIVTYLDMKDMKGSYTSHSVFAPIANTAQGITFAGGTSKSEGNLNDFLGKSTIDLGEFKLASPEVNATVPKLTGDINISEWAGTSALGTVNLASPQISIKSADMKNPMVFDLTLNSDTGQADQTLKGKLVTKLANITNFPDNELKFEAKNINYELQYDGLNQAGMDQLQKLGTQLQDIQARIGTGEQDTETPEEQRKAMELFGQIQEVSGKILETVFSQVLIADKSRFVQKLDLDNTKGKGQLAIDLTYHGAQKPPTMNDVLMGTYTMEQWADLVRGSITFNADKAMLPESIAQNFTGFVQQGMLVDQANQYQLNLKLNGKEVDLNGKTLPIAALLPASTPSIDTGIGTESTGQSVSAEDLEAIGLPADLAKEIAEKGLTPEIMKKLETNKNISPDMLEMMRQFQQMQQAPAAEDEGSTSEEDAPEENAPEGTAPDQPTPAQ